MINLLIYEWRWKRESKDDQGSGGEMGHIPENQQQDLQKCKCKQ